MPVRSFRFESKNPLVVIGLLSLVLALLLFFLSAALAVGAGVAVLGGVGFAARRLLRGNRPLVRGTPVQGTRQLDPAREVLPEAHGALRPLPRYAHDARDARDARDFRDVRDV